MTTLAGLTHPVLTRDRSELGARLRARTSPVVLVPTMGALHDGHAALMRVARERAGADGTVVVSIFVNPLQFGPDEDLDRYPRTLDADLEVAAREGVDVVFAPEVDEMYPGGVPHTRGASPAVGRPNAPRQGDGEAGPAVTVAPGPLAEILEGATRPGHFHGVLTVCAKLFGLIRPDAAIFGEKDFQQLSLIRRMVDDLCLGIEIVGAPTDREPDGLARSSRNQYLSVEQRQQAVALSQVLYAAREAGAAEGLASAMAAGRAALRRSDGVDLDYFTILTPELTELPARPAPGTRARALIAARVGATRLIDNMEIVLNPGPTAPAAGTTHTEGAS